MGIPFAVRATVYTLLIAAGREEALAGAVIVLGWPGFLGALWFSYRWVPYRFKQLGATTPGRPTPLSAGPPTPSRADTRRSGLRAGGRTKWAP